MLFFANNFLTHEMRAGKRYLYFNHVGGKTPHYDTLTQGFVFRGSSSFSATVKLYNYDACMTSSVAWSRSSMEICDSCASSDSGTSEIS